MVLCSLHSLQDTFDTMGPGVDGIKLAGGSGLAMQRQAVVDLIDTAHEHSAYAACAGSLEFVLQKVLNGHTNLMLDCHRAGRDSTHAAFAAFCSVAALTLGYDAQAMLLKVCMPACARSPRTMHPMAMRLERE